MEKIIVHPGSILDEIGNEIFAPGYHVVRLWSKTFQFGEEGAFTA
jgi:hypothetical protein